MKQHDNKAYIKWGLTIFTVVALSALFISILTNFSGFLSAVKAFVRVLSPLIFGAVFAFLLNPLVRVFERWFHSFFNKKMKSNERAAKTSRAIAIVLALILGVLMIYAFIAMMLPQIKNSVMLIVQNAPHYYLSVQSWLAKQLADNPQIAEHLTVLFANLQQFFQTWVSTTLPSDVQLIISTLTSSVVAVVKSVVNVLVGVFASVYILWRKDILCAQTKKLIAAVTAPKTANRILYLGRRTNEIFNGFVIGKIIDSLIVGFICYIGMLIFRLPYPELIATIIGVTNVIPFFGPFIGAIPSTFLILLVNPLQAFYFVVFILVVQQIDGNIIGPKILGNSLGISGLWVLVSITVATSLFGFAGMLLGVPVFALCYGLLSDWINNTLRRRALPTDTNAYRDVAAFEEISVKELSDTTK